VNDALQQDLSELSFEGPVSDLIKSEPLLCLPETPLRAAFERMHQARVGSIVVVNTFLEPVGILTRYDLISRIILPGTSLTAPISSVMSPDVICAPAHWSVMEAMICMSSHGIRHIPIVADGRLKGVISESDLVRHQRESLRSLSALIARASDLATLAQVSRTVRQLAQRLLTEGLAATAVARLVSHLNDAMTKRALTIVSEKTPSLVAGLPEWSWLALGSEGREEQTIATDQDNAIVFAAVDAEEADRLRPQFMRLAAELNNALAEIGFPLCKGGVMAQHEKWCRSLEEWKETMTDWFRHPTPERLLDAHTFLDFRPLTGALHLAEALRDWVTTEVKTHSLFLRELAQDSMRSSVGDLPRPVLFSAIARWLRRKNLPANWISPDRLDIKKDATAPVVAWSRVLALMNGISATSTDGRLAGLQAIGKVQRSEGQAIREAFDLAQRYRLRAQLSGSDQPNALLLDPLSLHEIDQLTYALDELARVKDAVRLDLRL
jgi:CBS domain-containing protein